MAEGIPRCPGTKRASEKPAIWVILVVSNSRGAIVAEQTNQTRPPWLRSRAASHCAPLWRWLSLHPVRERLEQYFRRMGGARCMRWGSSVTRAAAAVTAAGQRGLPQLLLCVGHLPAAALPLSCTVVLSEVHIKNKRVCRHGWCRHRAAAHCTSAAAHISYPPPSLQCTLPVAPPHRLSALRAASQKWSTM